MIVWLMGQPGSGKTTIAEELIQYAVLWHIDGDDLRGLLPNPGYDEEGRRQNIDRAQAIAAFIDAKIGSVVVSLIAPYRDQREAFKAGQNVLEVYLHTDEIRGREHYFVEDYEPPQENYVDIDTGACTVEEAVRTIHRAMAAFSRGP